MQSSAVVYSGPSMIDGAPIVAIATAHGAQARAFKEAAA